MSINPLTTVFLIESSILISLAKSSAIPLAESLKTSTVYSSTASLIGLKAFFLI